MPNKEINRAIKEILVINEGYFIFIIERNSISKKILVVLSNSINIIN